MSKPKVTPMLFSGDMVSALLDGRKTQTRRVIKPQPRRGVVSYECNCGVATFDIQVGDSSDAIESPTWLCPYGQPGDLIWVRETWSGDHAYADEKPSERVSVMTPDGPYYHDAIWYWADGDPEFGDWERPRPSIHMPRYASRLTLRITDVCVERVQDIGEYDAKEEGVKSWTAPEGNEVVYYSAKQAFAGLWHQLNAKRGHGWDVNPWVWAISFEVIHSNVDYVLAKEAA